LENIKQGVSLEQEIQDCSNNITGVTNVPARRGHSVIYVYIAKQMHWYIAWSILRTRGFKLFKYSS